MSWFQRRPVPTPSLFPGIRRQGRTGETTPPQASLSPVYGHADGLPFGMAAYPDCPVPPTPWFGGPTPAPARIPYPSDAERQQARS